MKIHLPLLLFELPVLAELILRPPIHVAQPIHVARKAEQQLLAPNNAASTFRESTATSFKMPPFRFGNYTVREHDGTACTTSGEKQWTGTVDVTNERRLFYWFFDSQRDPAQDPVIIWLNGGPGRSSLRGLFHELGPCLLSRNDNKTIINPSSWNKNASLLFLDQPAGVGFSQIKRGGTYASSDKEVARDLQTFLCIFFGQVFPDRGKLPIHFAGHYELFCSAYRGRLWDDETCQKIAEGVPELERLDLDCALHCDYTKCKKLNDFVNKLSLSHLFDEVISRKRNWYNIKQPCAHPDTCEPAHVGNFTEYLNRPDMLPSLGFPRSFVYRSHNLSVGNAINDSGDTSLPTVSSVVAILDAASTYSHRQGGGNPIRLLVLNGNEDGLCNTPGARILYERLSWTGAAGYRAQRWRPLGDLGLNNGSGEWKRSDDGRLLFIGVDEAGHMMPMDQPEVADWTIRNWIEGLI
ncbi:hypothetical protein NLG97_g2091 [Lecanicillium saksenae]|uniref:Uncharacterized protein n=1 Tax=Lecanicillium saksenae TaxID=468837 RepID=A0ACC1R1V9_9HYPO|nr:hypothetical protein NLG97_g2091 [Lecanicillium saksenae]